MPNSTTYNRILSKGIEAELPAVSDGKLRFTTDTGRLFLDTGSSRVEISDFIKGKTAEEITGLLAPLPKFYLASDTNILYFYAGGSWNTIKALNASTADYAKNAINTITRSGNTFTATRFDGSTFTFTQQNTTYGVVSTSANGLAPKVTNTSGFLKGDGTWAVPGDTKYAAGEGLNLNSDTFSINKDASTVKYATQAGSATSAANATCATNASSVSGFTVGKSVPSNAVFTDTTYANMTSATAGLAPAGGSGTTKYLRQDGTWQVPPNDNTTYGAGTGLSLGTDNKFSINQNASTVKYATSAGSATNAGTAQYANAAGTADSATSATNSSTAEYATNAGSASNATCATNASSVGGFTVGVSVPANAKFTDNDTKNTAGATDTSSKIFLVGATSQGANPQTYTHDTAYVGADGYLYSGGNKVLTTSEKGAASGVAELDSAGKVPSSQLPSFVDDVIEGYYYNSKFYEDSAHTTEITPESGKIYVDLSTDKTYRWSGTAYTQIKGYLALGETSTTAYIGDRGKIAYDHSQAAHAPSNAQPNQNAFSNVKVGSTTIAADTTTDTLEIAAGTNITLTPDATNDKLTITATDTTYAAGEGLSLNSGTFSINKDASTVKYATSAGSATSATNATCATNASSVGGYTVGKSVPSNAVFTDTKYAAGTGLALNSGTFSVDSTASTVAYATNSGTATYANNSGNATCATNASSVGGFTVGVSVPANAKFTDTTYATFSTASNGLVKASGSGGAAKFLKGDNTWGTPTDTKYAAGTGLSLNSGTFSIDSTASTVAYANNAGSATNATCATNASSVSGFTVGKSVPSNAVFTDTTYTNVTSATAGLAPAGGSGTTKYLRQDGSWQVPPDNNTTYGNATTATAGLLPTLAGGTEKYLRADGTWVKPPNDNTTYGNMTSAAAGLAPAGGSGTTKYLRQDGSWQVPPNDNTTYDLSAYVNNVTTSGSGNAITGFTKSGNTLTLKKDTTFPTSNTTYADMTTAEYDTGTSTTTRVLSPKRLKEIFGLANAASATNASTAEYAINAGSATNASSVGGFTVGKSVPANAVFTDTTYSAGTGISISSTKAISLATTGTAGTYGPTADVTGSNNTTIAVPQITTDSYGRVTGATTFKYTSKDTSYSGMTTAEFNAGTLTTTRVISPKILKDIFGMATASSATNAGTAAYAIVAGNATSSDNASSAGYATNAGTADYATNAASVGGYTVGKSVPSNAVFTDTTYSTFSTAVNGLVPKPSSAATTSYLNSSGTWTTPANTTYGLVSTAANGLAPKVTDTSKFLKGDGTWATPTNTTYGTVSTAANGLAPKVTDTSKFLKGDGTWATPTNTTYANVTSAAAGLAPAGGSGTTKYLRQDGSWQVPPNDNTTYGNMTSAAAGLAPAGGSGTTKYLRQDGSWQVPPNDNTTYSDMTTAEFNTGTATTTRVLSPKRLKEIFSVATASSATNASTAAYAVKAEKDASGNVITSTYAPKASPALTGTPTTPDATTATNNTQIANTKFVHAVVDAKIADLPEPMVFKGSLGTGGTITALPVDGTAKVGDTYKVITAGTYASKAAKVGDTFICLTKTSTANTWELIPSGDEPAGTVTSVAVSNDTNGGLTVTGSPITSSGTIKLKHTNQVTAGTAGSTAATSGSTLAVPYVTYDANGHVTAVGTHTHTVTGFLTGITKSQVTTALGYTPPQNDTTYANMTTAEYSTGTSTESRVLTPKTLKDIFGMATASSATNAASATYATNAGSATSATNASSAGYATSAGSATSATSATNASSSTYATSAGSATSATNSSTSDYAKNAIKSVAWSATSAASTFTFTRENNGTFKLQLPKANSSSVGLMPKLDGTTTNYLRGDGTWATPVDTTKLPLAGGTLTGRVSTTKPVNQILVGTGTAATTGTSPHTYIPAKWTFNTSNTATDGDIITIKIPVAGHSYGVYLSIDNGTNYYPIVCNGTSRLTTHYGVNTYLTVVFEPTGSAAAIYPVDGGDSTITATDGVWRVINFYDSNSDSTGYNVRRYYTCMKAGPNKVFPYTFIMETADGRWESIVTSSSTATSKSRNTHGFKLGQVLCMNANATYNEDVVIGAANVFESSTINYVDHRYSFNTANTATGGTVANKPVYLVGSLGTDGLFYLDTTWWTQTLPTTDDGKLYIHIGDAADYYRMVFNVTRPIYWFKNGKLRLFTQDAQTVTGHTVAVDVPANANFNNTTYGNMTSAAAGLAPAGGSGTTKYLRQDGSWQVPPNTTYGVVSTTSNGLAPTLPNDDTKYLNGKGNWTVPVGTTYANVTSAAAGLAPAGGSGTTKYLRQDGSWQVPPNTTYGNATTAAAGLLPTLPNDATKYLNGTGNWTKPDNTTYSTFSTATNGLVPKPSSAATTSYLNSSGTWTTPANTTYGNMTSATAGLAPAGGSGTTKYLRQDGSWQVPPNDNTTYANVTSATAGLAPAGGSGTTKYLRQDGSWQVPPNDNTTYGVVSTTANGLAPKVTSTSGFLKGDGTWATPTNTTYANVTSATAGLAPAGGSGTTKYLRQDGSWQVPPNDNTTYGNMTSAAAGLAPAGGSGTTKYLRQDGSWQVPSYPSIPSTMSVNEGTAGTVTTARTMNAVNLKGILQGSTYIYSYTPCVEADFDFGELASTTYGDETYNQ